LKTLIGRSDIVDFPKLNLFGIDIKIDTGAYTSSIHCHDIVEKDDILQCRFLDPEHKNYHEKIFHFKNYKIKNVKSSNGIVEKRFLIATEIVIFDQTFPILLTITERGSMKYPVLLGRKFLSRKFVVDTAQKNLSYDKIQIKIN
jgi:hypothetical protein